MAWLAFGCWLLLLPVLLHGGTNMSALCSTA
jgi:hypothetical protein